jgi:hypothetical protein
MVKHHEVPTHLDVEDKVLLGLSVRQFLYLLVGSSAAYTLWEQPALMEPLRLGLVTASVCLTLAFALLRPAGRTLEEWLAAALVYAASARCSTWRPREPDPADWLPSSGGWHELTPSLNWAEDTTECA